MAFSKFDAVIKKKLIAVNFQVDFKYVIGFALNFSKIVKTTLYL